MTDAIPKGEVSAVAQGKLSAKDVVTHRRVLNIAIPIVISNATVPILGAVDTGVVGQIGLAAPIGAVGIGAIILSSLYWVFGFLRMGTIGVTARAWGAGDTSRCIEVLAQSLVIALTLGILLILLVMVLTPLVRRPVGINLEKAVDGTDEPAWTPNSTGASGPHSTQTEDSSER